MKLTELPMRTYHELLAAGFRYHNYFMVGVHDAVRYVQEGLPGGWRAWYGTQWTDAPEGAIRVGYVKVRTADPAYILYVYPA